MPEKSHDAGRRVDPGVESRRVAERVLTRVARDGAYANLVLQHALSDAQIAGVDAKLITDLVYGTLRRQRSCDFLVDRFLVSDPPDQVRSVLRLGAYQLAFRSDIPPYAAVSATVSCAPKRFRGLCNAVLRKVAKASFEYPDLGESLSYPDWIIEQLTADLGESRALAALESMNEPASRVIRPDGYSQDLASQMVVDIVGARSGEVVADLCAAPGGKATGMAASGATVLASDLTTSRTHLLEENALRYGDGRVLTHVCDATNPGLRESSCDRVLIDAPCSGLGVLRRRPDARWRIDAQAPQRLVEVQRSMVAAAVPLLRDGGVLVYSVCTLTAVESIGIDDWIADRFPNLVPDIDPPDSWQRHGRGAILLPQTIGSDGMCAFRYRYSQGEQLEVQ